MIEHNAPYFLDIACHAAEEAVAILQHFDQKRELLHIEKKGLNDFVSQADRAAEEKIISIIQDKLPNHAILGEESGSHRGQDSNSPYQWIIDPLDGTTNFLHAVPQYAVSIGLQVNDLLEVAVIADPNRNETFTAIRNEGAFCNGERIQTSNQERLEGALLATGTPFKDLNRLDEYTDILKALIRANTAGIRRPGAAALDFAWLACGRFDAFWEFGLAPWDIAAGALILKEAGGRISNFKGQELNLHQGNVLASNTHLHPELLNIMAIHLNPAYDN